MKPTSPGSSSRAERLRFTGQSPGTGAILPGVDSEPEYMICIDCESPTYTFDWSNEKIVTILCEVCGNDDPSEFVTESEYEDMTAP